MDITARRWHGPRIETRELDVDILHGIGVGAQAYPNWKLKYQFTKVSKMFILFYCRLSAFQKANKANIDYRDSWAPRKMPCPGGMPERHSPNKADWMWHQIGGPLVYNQTNVPSNPLYINHIKWQNLNISQLVLQLFFALYWSKVEKDEVVGAAPTGDAPATSEWSTILLPTKVRLILEVGWYLHLEQWKSEFWCPYRHVTRVFTCFFHELSIVI